MEIFVDQKKNETEVQNISRDQVEVVLKLEGQLLHEKVHVLVNLEPVQVVGVALEDAQVIVVFSFVFAMKKQVLKKKKLHLEPHEEAAKGDIC